MSSCAKIRLVDETITASINSDPVSLDSGQKNFLFHVKVSSRTNGTYTVKLQHSADKLAWVDVVTLAAIVSDTSEIIQLVHATNFYKLHLASFARAVVTYVGPGQASVVAELLYDRDK